jgi:hypothetical protein
MLELNGSSEGLRHDLSDVWLDAETVSYKQNE